MIAFESNIIDVDFLIDVMPEMQFDDKGNYIVTDLIVSAKSKYHYDGFPLVYNLINSMDDKIYNESDLFKVLFKLIVLHTEIFVNMLRMSIRNNTDSIGYQ